MNFKKALAEALVELAQEEEDWLNEEYVPEQLEPDGPSEAKVLLHWWLSHDKSL